MQKPKANDDIPWYLKDLIPEQPDPPNPSKLPETTDISDSEVSNSKVSTVSEEEESKLSSSASSIETSVQEENEQEVQHHNDNAIKKNQNVEYLYGVHFTPFSGSEDEFKDLIQNSKNNNNNAYKQEEELLDSTNNNDVKLAFLRFPFVKDIDLLYNVIIATVGVGVCLIITLKLKSCLTKEKYKARNDKYKVRNEKYKPRKETTRYKSTRDKDPKIEVIKEQECKGTILIDKAGSKQIQSKNDNDNDNNVTEMQQKELKSVSSMHDNSTCISTSTTATSKKDFDFFLNDVPALAEVIALSGLDKQESTKIVIKEKFETERRNAEVGKHSFH